MDFLMMVIAKRVAPDSTLRKLNALMDCSV